MAYKTYTTKALICGSKDSYTSDRSYRMFTEDAGMLWASARSVREERSKQRCALQEFSLIRVSLVRGRTGWRIGSVSTEINAYNKAQSRAARGGVTSVVRLLRQYLHGEEAHPGVFLDTTTVLERLSSIDEDEVTTLVELYTLRILHKLGYIAPNKNYDELLDDTDWYHSPLPLPPAAHQAVEQALRASHL